MDPPTAKGARRERGLADLRRSGTVTELLFLFECLTEEPTQLRPVADQLGLTVQAASHTFRGLARRGLAEVRDGRYRATVAGVAWLHGTLGDVSEDLRGRLDRMHVVRSTRAVAAVALEAGGPVSLALEDGILTARPGRDGASRGRTAGSARRGGLVEIVDLEGIVPLSRGSVRVLTVPLSGISTPEMVEALRVALAKVSEGLLAAQGLEAFHVLQKATDRPILRFAVPSACQEASRVGVPSTVVVLATELPRFLAPFDGPDPPPITVTRVQGPRRTGRSGPGKDASSGAARGDGAADPHRG
jgi:predicted transcriptional regulator